LDLINYFFEGTNEEKEETWKDKEQPTTWVKKTVRLAFEYSL